MRICNKQNIECHGSFCLPLSWVVCQVARVSHRMTRVPYRSCVLRSAGWTRNGSHRYSHGVRQVRLKHGQNKVKNVRLANQFIIKLVRTRRKTGSPKTTAWIKALNVLFQFIQTRKRPNSHCKHRQTLERTQSVLGSVLIFKIRSNKEMFWENYTAW